MWPNPIPANLLTFTEEILNEKLHFCAVSLRNLSEPENSSFGKNNFLKQKMEITFFRQITDNLTFHSLAFLMTTWLTMSVLKRVYDKIYYKYASVSLLQSYEIFCSCLIFKCYIYDAGSTNYLIIFKSIFCECKHFLVNKQCPIYAKKFFLIFFFVKQFFIIFKF